LTVEDYLEGWLAAIRVTMDGTTWKNYRTVLRSYVIPWIRSPATAMAD
jgi:Phage integrase, N-terminal SAM-like domain